MVSMSLCLGSLSTKIHAEGEHETEQICIESTTDELEEIDEVEEMDPVEGDMEYDFENLFEKAYYAQNVVCVIESCQNVSGNEGLNVYCNSKKKSGPHWNCSWINGIKHTESFHYHK